MALLAALELMLTLLVLCILGMISVDLLYEYIVGM